MSRDAPMMMRRWRNRKTPPTAARPRMAPAYSRSFAAVTPPVRSSMAYFSTHGPARVIAVVATMQTKPKRNAPR